MGIIEPGKYKLTFEFDDPRVRPHPMLDLLGSTRSGNLALADGQGFDPTQVRITGIDVPVGKNQFGFRPRPQKTGNGKQEQ